MLKFQTLKNRLKEKKNRLKEKMVEVKKQLSDSAKSTLARKGTKLAYSIDDWLVKREIASKGKSYLPIQIISSTGKSLYYFTFNLGKKGHAFVKSFKPKITQEHVFRIYQSANESELALAIYNKKGGLLFQAKFAIAE